MNRFTIKDLEKFSGIKAHTIRIWEKRYKLLNPSRTGTNIRYYSDDDLRRILNVSFLNKHGLKISKIAVLGDTEIVQQIHGMESEHQYEAYIDRFIVAAMQFSVEEFQLQFQACEKKFGFHKTIIQIIYPLMQRIGTLWGTQELSPAHEHFISNLVRLRLLHAIQNIRNVNQGKPRFLLFLHQHESHDIGLLFAWYLLRSEGHKVVYLGANVPTEGLVHAYKELKPDGMFTIFTSSFHEDGFRKLINELSAVSSKTRILVAMPATWEINFELPRNISRLAKMEDFVAEASLVS